MSALYRPDRDGTGALMRSAGIADHMESIAEDAQRYAESIAPDAPELGQGYVASFHTEKDEANISRTRRSVSRLVNDADHAGAVESRMHVLSRTRDHIESTYG